MIRIEAIIVLVGLAVVVGLLGWNKLLQKDLDRHMDENAIIHPPLGLKGKPIDSPIGIDREFIGGERNGNYELIYESPK